MTGFAYIIRNQRPLFIDSGFKMRFCGILRKITQHNTEKCTVL